MGAAATGPQFTIRPWDLGRELLVYLASEGVGTFVPGALTSNTLWLGKLPSTPTIAGALSLDPSPNTTPGLSRPHFTLTLRDAEQGEGALATRLARAYELLDRVRPPLPSFDCFCEVDNLPGAFQYEANRYPVGTLGVRTAGMVHRA